MYTPASLTQDDAGIIWIAIRDESGNIVCFLRVANWHDGYSTMGRINHTVISATDNRYSHNTLTGG